MTRRYWNINLQEMMKMSLYMGKKITKRHPNMVPPYICARFKGRYLINLTQTARFLSAACDSLFDAARDETGEILFIAPPKPRKITSLITRAARRARCHYINSKWLRGMLTNWSTTSNRLIQMRNIRIDQSTGRLARLSKRDAALQKKELAYLEKHMTGIQYMERLPAIAIIVDQKQNYLALRECRLAGIGSICLVDTDCDPLLADISIPTNTRSLLALRFILNKFVFAIDAGYAQATGPKKRYHTKRSKNRNLGRPR
uniref:Small ribosomal subunit protein uS2c n=1 Tax=Hypertelis spergulacea TaxID=764270 RepID=A0A411L8V0_9CARY|nr:ribosomal protein S2 [Hypertelis spergulacea]